MKRRWPPHEYELAKQWREIGMTYREIGEALDRTECAVKEKIVRRGK